MVDLYGAKIILIGHCFLPLLNLENGTDYNA